MLVLTPCDLRPMTCTPDPVRPKRLGPDRNRPTRRTTSRSRCSAQVRCGDQPYGSRLGFALCCKGTSAPKTFRYASIPWMRWPWVGGLDPWPPALPQWKELARNLTSQTATVGFINLDRYQTRPTMASSANDLPTNVYRMRRRRFATSFFGGYFAVIKLLFRTAWI